MQKRAQRSAALAAALIVLLAAGGALWWRQRPAAVAEDALTKLGTARTQRFNAALTIDNTSASAGQLAQAAQVQLLLDGEFQRQEEERDSLSAKVQLATETEGLAIRIEGDTRFIGDKAYVRIATAPQTFPVLVQLKDKWVELPRGGAGEQGAAPTEGLLFMEVEKTGSETVDDRRVSVYSAQATSAAVVRLLDNIADILGTRLTAEQIAGIQQGITGVETVPLTLKVTPWSHELIELSTTLAIPGSNTVSFTLKPRDRNEALTITPPDGAVTLENAVAGLETSAAPVAPAPAPTAAPAPAPTPAPAE
jgi:hypothetical protein